MSMSTGTVVVVHDVGKDTERDGVGDVGGSGEMVD